MALPVYKTTPIRVLHLEGRIPAAKTLLEEARNRDCLRIGKLLKAHSVTQMAEFQQADRYSQTARPGQPWRRASEDVSEQERKIHSSIKDEGTKFNINITARETEDGPKCGVEIEYRQHQVMRTAIVTGHTSTKRDAVLAIHLEMGQYAGNEQNLFIFSTNTAGTWNDIVKGRTLVSVTEDLLPFAKKKRLKVKGNSREGDSRI